MVHCVYYRLIYYVTDAPTVVQADPDRPDGWLQRPCAQLGGTPRPCPDFVDGWHTNARKCCVQAPGGLTDEDRQKLAALNRRTQEGDKKSRFESVLAELEFIEWPPLGQAAVDTFVVIAIVLGSSAFLFVVNSVLAEGAKRIFA